MTRLKIVSSGRSFRSRSRLLEAIITDVLVYSGYRIDRILGVGDARMQIDVEGQQAPSGPPFYAECRCTDNRISAAELQAFFGKYMARWHKNKTCRGIFIAVPGLDDSAKEFFKEHIEGNAEVEA